MAISLSQLRIEAVMDASAYERGATAKSRADDQMVRSGQQLTGTLEATDRRLGSSSTALERLTRSVDPTYAATQRLESAQRTLQRALDAGRISAEEYERRLALVQQRYAVVPQAAGAAAVSTNQLRFATQNLMFQLNDIGTSLASGGSPFRVLAQQAGQVQQAISQGGGLGPVLGSVATSLRSMITPTTAAVAGIAALAAGIGVLVARAADTNQSIRVFDVLLKGMGDTALTNAASLEAAAKRLRDVGLSAADARQQILAVGRAGLNPGAAESIIRTGANLSAYLGGDQTQALTQALSGGVESAVKYGIAVRALTVEEAGNRLEMARHGQAAQALDLILQSITGHAQGLRDKGMSPLAKSVEQMAVAWNNLLDRLSNSRPIVVLTDSLTGLINALDKLAQGKPPAWLSSLLAVQTLGIGGIGGGSALASGAAALAGQAPPVATAAIPVDMNALVQAVIQVESRGKAGAVSPAGAMGLMQLMPGTAAQYGVNNPFDAEQNVAGGTNYLKDLLAKYNGNVEYALMAYNWGPGNLDKALAGQKAIPSGVQGYARQVVGAANSYIASGGVSTTTPGTFAKATLEADEYAKAQQRAADATKGLGLEQEFARIKAEVAGRTDIDAAEKARLETDLRAAAVTRLTNEIANQNTATAQEIRGAQQIADAYRQSADQGKIHEAIIRSQSEALQRFGTTATTQAQGFIGTRAEQLIAQERLNESLKNAQDLLAGRDTQAQLQLQIGLVGQLPEIVQRELTLLQAKQQIERDFPFLTDQEKANRLAMVTATADLNVKLAETQRAQQQIDSMFSSIGNTISSSIGDLISSIFDGKKITDWGAKLKSILSSIGNSILQGLLIKPLTGDILGALGASPTVTSQYGSLSGGGSIFSLGNLSTGASLLNNGSQLVNGGSSGLFSGNGLFSGVGSFLNNTVGPSLGFATPATQGLGSLIGIENSTLAAAGIDTAGAAAIPGSIFGSLSLTSALPFLGIGGALLGMLLPSLLSHKPRNQSSGANFDLSNFSLTAGFSGGNSQIDQATQQVAQGLQQFLALLKTTGGALSGNVLLQNGVNTGFTVDSSLPQYSGRFNLGKDPTAALQTIELALSKSLTGITDTMRRVLDQISDPAELQGAIAFANAYDKLSEAAADAFKTVEQGKNEIGPFATAMGQINTLFQGLTDQANRFGLALDPINAALAEATTRLQGDFTDALKSTLNESSGAGFINQLQSVYDNTLKAIQESQAVGLGSDPGTQKLLDQVYQSQLNQILSGLSTTQLDQVITHFTGLNDAIVILAQSAETAAGATSDLAAAQQLAAQAAQATQQIQDYLNQLNDTPGTFVSPENALLNATHDYQVELRKAQGGDVGALSDITQFADRLIKDIESYYASSLYGQSLVKEIEDQLKALIGITPTQQDPVLVTNDLLTQQITKTENVATTVSGGTQQTALTITSSTQSLIDSNNAASQQAATQNSADTATLAGVVNATAAANIASNDNAAAALIAGADAGTAAMVSAIYGAANSLINVGATYSNATSSAVYGAASEVISTEALYGNNLLIAISTASASNDNLVSSTNLLLNNLYQADVYYGDIGIQQRQDITNLLTQIRDSLNLWLQRPAA